MQNNNIYYAFRLTIHSDFILPELEAKEVGATQVDLEIRRRKLREIPSTILPTQSYFYIKENYCLFQIPNIAAFLVENGTSITVSPMVENKEDVIRLYLLGTCMGILLIQRGILPLHGSAVVLDGKAYAIVGDSGAGKSTLASSFIEKGYTLMTDDIIPVVFNEENEPIVIPTYPHQKLWLQTLEQYEKDHNDFQPIAYRETKYSVPVSDQFCKEPVPLAGLFELEATDTREVIFHSIEKLDIFQTLFKHTFRNFVVTESGLMDWHFQTSIKLASKVTLTKIERPKDRFTANEISNEIIHQFSKRESNQVNEKMLVNGRGS
ncbi:aldolase [Evansella sp. AB-rgal1]|uniref:aldolase n=1 Tax=Evansella sp. AB-rgal1 TaxID=3242696 RepID=UPI00359DA42D